MILEMSLGDGLLGVLLVAAPAFLKMTNHVPGASVDAGAAVTDELLIGAVVLFDMAFHAFDALKFVSTRRTGDVLLTLGNMTHPVIPVLQALITSLAVFVLWFINHVIFELLFVFECAWTSIEATRHRQVHGPAFHICHVGHFPGRCQLLFLRAI